MMMMSSFVLLLSPLYISICFFLSYIYSIISLSLLTFYRFQLLIDWERKIAIVIIIHYQLTFLMLSIMPVEKIKTI